MENMLEHHVVDSWTGAGNECLNALSVSELARALYVGYEVEEEFKEGDWVTAMHRTGIKSIGRVIDVVDGKVYAIWTTFGEDVTTGHGHYGLSNVEHATDEEIAREKTRRWWAKHDRQPWEIREGDILNVNDEYLEVERIEGNTITFSTFDDWIELDEMKHNIDVVCFAKDRKDIGGV